jgi:hypothetical protein
MIEEFKSRVEAAMLKDMTAMLDRVVTGFYVQFNDLYIYFGNRVACISYKWDRDLEDSEMVLMKTFDEIDIMPFVYAGVITKEELAKYRRWLQKDGLAQAKAQRFEEYMKLRKEFENE